MRNRMKEIRVVVPDQVYQKLREISKETGISVSDIILRAIVKVLEEFEKVKKGGRG